MGDTGDDKYDGDFVLKDENVPLSLSPALNSSSDDSAPNETTSNQVPAGFCDVLAY